MGYAPNFISAQGFKTLSGSPLLPPQSGLAMLPVNSEQVRHKLYINCQVTALQPVYGGGSAIFQFLFSYRGQPVASQLFAAAYSQQPADKSVPTVPLTSTSSTSGMTLFYYVLPTYSLPGYWTSVLLQPYNIVCRADTLTVNLIETNQIYFWQFFVGLLTN